MLSPRWRKVLRDVWLHKSRSAMVVLAITIGIVGAGAVLDTWALIRQATRDEFRESNPASATLRTDSVSPSLLKELRAFPDLEHVQARRTVAGTVRLGGKRNTAILYVHDDFTKVRIGAIKAERGAWPPATSTIVVEHSSVEFVGAGIGDTLTLQIGDGPAVLLPVIGVARDVGLAPGWMEHVMYGFINRETLAKLGMPTSLNEIQVTVRDHSLNREGVRQVAYAVKAKLEAAGHPVSDVDVPEPGRHIHAPQIESLLYTQGAFGVLALVLSGLLVINLIAAMLSGQVREIGVMKAIGASGKQIAVMYLALAFGLGIVACVIAIPVAAQVGSAYAAFTADILNFSLQGRVIPTRIILLQIAVGALLPVLAASIPVIRGCRISVSEALRDLGLVARGDQMSRLLHRASGVSRPLLLSLRNAFRRRQRMILTLLTLSTGGAVYLGALNLRASIVRSVDLIFSAQQYDASLRFTVAQPIDSLEAAVRGVSGVRNVEAYSATRANRSHADGNLGETFALMGPSPATRMFVPALIEGRWLTATDSNAIVINHRIAADDSTLKVGGELPIVVAGRITKWRIVGVVETGPSAMAFVSRAVLSRMVADGLVDRVALSSTIPDAASIRDLLIRIRPTLADRGLVVQSSELTSANRSVIEDHLLMVAGFLGVMSQLMIVVGGLGLAATMSLGVLERTREIGVLRAIGARHRAIFAIVQVEGLVIALASWIIALPLSVPMSNVLGRAFGQIMFRVPVLYVPEANAVVRWLVVVVGVSIVACAWPAFRAMRITTAAALAYE